jgi:hypothetical protein
MNKGYALDNVECSKEKQIYSVELASALMPCLELDEILNFVRDPNSTLFVPAMPNELGMGDVASNFRYKHDSELNNQVVENWMSIFKELPNKHSNPVVITAIGRSSRLYTMKMLEDGSIQIIDNTIRSEDMDKTSLFQGFLSSFDIDADKLLKIRMSSEGARFNTYLADMIGFLNVVNWFYNRDIFYTKTLEPYKVNTTMTYHRAEVSGQKMLTPVVINGKQWTPKEDFDYLYFRDQDKIGGANNSFCMVSDEHFPLVYSQLFDAISPEDNSVKEMIRNYFTSINKHVRHSDFWVNDVDDAFTLLMIANCFKAKDSLTVLEGHILSQFETIIERVFQ